MGRKRHTAEEIINSLRQAEIMLSQGNTAREAVRQIGITEQTYYRWRKEYAGMDTSQAQRLKDLDLVFPGCKGGIRGGTALTRRFDDRLRRRGLQPIRWHALRRLFAAVLQDDGVPLERIRDLMGHSTLSVNESYAYTLPASLDRSTGSIDRAFGRMGG